MTACTRRQIHLLGISDRVEAIVYPDERQLVNLYRSSLALVYPSLHEGFWHSSAGSNGLPDISHHFQHDEFAGIHGQRRHHA